MRFAILVSGTGTNLQSLLDKQTAGELGAAEIVLVISNRPGVVALERARTAGVKTVVVDHKQHADRPSFERALLDELNRREVEAIVLAGFMRILTDTFLGAFPNRVINTHPSLLPAFPGMHGAQQAIDYGVKITGCTIHLVAAGVDTGPIILQAPVRITDEDDHDSLQQRIQVEEHRLLPEATKLMAAGRLVCEGRRVRIV
jgi:phosphoribosylglycinamide formyltransferase-1